MATISGAVTYAFRPVIRRLIPDFVPQNPLLNLGFVAPGNPIFQKDLSPPVRRSPWMPSQYEAAPDVPLPIFAPVPPNVFPPLVTSWDLPLRTPGRMQCLFDGPNVALLGQSSSRFSPFQPPDLTLKMIPRPVLPIDYPPNLVLNLLVSNPYIPVDVSGRAPAAKRNSSLNFDAPNLAVRLGTGAAPIRPIDWNMQAPVRRPVIFDAPNLAVSLSSGLAPIIPADISRPVRAPLRCASIYEAQNGTLPALITIPAPYPAGTNTDHSVQVIATRYLRQRLFAAADWIITQQAILISKPVLTAQIPNLLYRINSGIQTYNAGSAFNGAASFTISPALDAGITFSGATGVITTDTGVAVAGSHGPYTITATNSNGTTVSNAFSISLGAGNYCVDGPRLIESTSALGTTYVISGPHVTRDVPISKDLS